MSVMVKLCASVWALLLDREPEPRSWKDLHVGAELGTGCEQIHLLLTAVVQKHWKCECRVSCEDMPLFAASLNFNTCFRCGQAECDGERAGGKPLASWVDICFSEGDEEPSGPRGIFLTV